MTRHYETGLTGLAWFGIILTGCGGWVDLANPELGEAGGTGGQASAAGGAGGHGGSGMNTGGTNAPSANMPAVNGEGGELSSEGGASVGGPVAPRFEFIEAPPPTLVPDGADAEGVSWVGVANILSGSLENGVLLGNSEYCFKRIGTANCEWNTNEPFIWTEADGVSALDGLDGLEGTSAVYPSALSTDGQIVVGSFRTADRMGFFRWTKGSGVTRLGEPLATASGGPEHMSLDGTVVSGLAKVTAVSGGKDAAGHQPFLWTAAEGYRALSSFATWPAGAEIVDMSDDGAILIGQTAQTPRQLFWWAPATGVEFIEGSSGCRFYRANADSQVVFGTCQLTPERSATFVWTRAGEAARVEDATGEPCDLYPATLTKHGTVAFGNATCGAQQDQAVRWSAATGAVALPAPAVGHAIVDQNFERGPARAVALGFLYVDDGVRSADGDKVLEGQAFLFTDAQGLITLTPLAGDTASAGYATDAEAKLVVGRSGTRSATLWDEERAVSIADYLTSLGIDRHGVPLYSGQRISSSDDTLIIQGDTDQHLGAWIAWLPRR